MSKMNRRRFTQTAVTGAAVAASVVPATSVASAASEAVINTINLPEHARVCIVVDKFVIIWEWTGGKFVERFRGGGIPPECTVAPYDLFQK